MRRIPSIFLPLAICSVLAMPGMFTAQVKAQQPATSATKPRPSATAAAQSSPAQAKMKVFIDALMKKMTIDEKIGQLNLLVGGEATTGSVVSTGVEDKIRKGQVGGIFSVTSPQRIRKVQELAINNSRLKIPIIFGLDVIHGYRTAFPIPLALAASWDMPLIERSARMAAQEASAD